MEKLARLQFDRDLFVNHVSDLQEFMEECDSKKVSIFEIQVRLEEFKVEYNNYKTNQRELEILDIDNLSDLKSERKQYTVGERAFLRCEYCS